jgi:hypothetical protein
LAKDRRTSVNELMEEMATTAIAAHDAMIRFRALAARGNIKRALAILERLDRR